MELNSEFIIQLEKDKSKKVKCFKFKVKELNREFAIHVNSNNKDISTVSDVITGCKAFNIKKKPEEVKQDEINQEMQAFIKHYTEKEILKKLKTIEENNGK